MAFLGGRVAGDVAVALLPKKALDARAQTLYDRSRGWG